MAYFIDIIIPIYDNMKVIPYQVTNKSLLTLFGSDRWVTMTSEIRAIEPRYNVIITSFVNESLMNYLTTKLTFSVALTAMANSGHIHFGQGILK